MTGEVVSATGDNIYSLRIYPVFCNQKKSRFHSLSLYQRAVGVFAPLGFTPLFCNQKKSCFHSPAVPDGVPGRRIFSIPVSPGYTDGSPAFSHEKSLAAKRGIIIIPSAAGAAPPLKGRGQSFVPKSTKKKLCAGFFLLETAATEKRRIFSIPILPGYTDGSKTFPHEKSLAAKRGIIIIPSARSPSEKRKIVRQKALSVSENCGKLKFSTFSIFFPIECIVSEISRFWWKTRFLLKALWKVC